MSNIETEKIQALQKHWQDFRCEHDDKTSLRKRIVKGGGIQYVYQCLKCGAATTNAIAREKAIKLNDGKEPDAYDVTLEQKWKQASKDGANKITGHYDNLSEFHNKEFHKWYSQYLESEEWKSKKEKVLTRANHICEGCLEAPAVVVHHTTYKNVGAEFLFELIALCNPCHERYHENDEI